MTSYEIQNLIKYAITPQRFYEAKKAMAGIHHVLKDKGGTDALIIRAYEDFVVPEAYASVARYVENTINSATPNGTVQIHWQWARNVQFSWSKTQRADGFIRFVIVALDLDNNEKTTYTFTLNKGEGQYSCKIEGQNIYG